MTHHSIFGTDGIRGEANIWPITPDFILKLAVATGHHFMSQTTFAGHPKFTVLIGKDTRLSGYMVESALVAGFVSVGIDVIQLGPIPTPGVAILTRSLRADLGVMISASHNPYTDNGIKFFKHDGQKISLDDEQAITTLVQGNVAHLGCTAKAFGKAMRLDDALGRYNEFVKSTFPRGQRLDGLRIVIDCAHGAAYKVAPRVLWELGAEVIAIGTEPKGDNINDNCGATHPTYVAQHVLHHNAHVGIALDGDADRVIMVDEKGQTICGDQLLAAIALRMKKMQILSGQGVVSTVMSNLGLERFLKAHDIHLYRSAVGDRHVARMMQQHHCNVGGEPSGHIVFSDYCPTGDGLIAALQILSLIQETGRPASEILSVFTPVPQKMINIPLKSSVDLTHSHFTHTLDKVQKTLGTRGQVVVRPSGTEPLIRLMAQGDDDAQLLVLLSDLKESIENLQNNQSDYKRNVS